MNCIYVRRRYLAAVGKGRINVGVYEVFRKTSWRINCILPAKRLVYLVNVEKRRFLIQCISTGDIRRIYITFRRKINMKRFRSWYAGFMQGRYGERGIDEYGRFLNIVTIVFLILSMLFRKISIFPAVSRHWLPTKPSLPSNRPPCANLMCKKQIIPTY